MFDCHHVWLKWCEGQSLNLFKMNNEKRIPGQLTGRMFDCHHVWLKWCEGQSLREFQEN